MGTTWQWWNLLANIKINESRSIYFALALTVSEILTFKISYLQKVGQVHGVQFSQCHSMANVKIYKCHFLTFLIFAKIRPM